MAFSGASAKNDRLKSATAMVLIHVVAGYAILKAFDYRRDDVLKSALTRLNVIDISIPPVVMDEKPKHPTQTIPNLQLGRGKPPPVYVPPPRDK
ncbi:hypothetical protein [Sphingorhabdus sp.]|uniref:hypothetical protein n=1 Tax=Sphingorhabdus sp. TaxID=1902408 RepID=UPI0039830AAE